mmetsp:Transcript_40177/g.72373  ORF Transcript_40177/g.72373 Transcript_40177/m.72373 type:complete len:418 (-) Transcript_40177:1089-2342(-)
MFEGLGNAIVETRDQHVLCRNWGRLSIGRSSRIFLLRPIFRHGSTNTIALLLRRLGKNIIGIPQPQMNRPRGMRKRQHVPHIRSGRTPIVKRKQMHPPQISNRYIENILIVHQSQFIPGIEQIQQGAESIPRLDLAHLVQHIGNGGDILLILRYPLPARQCRRQHAHGLTRRQQRSAHEHRTPLRRQFRIRILLLSSGRGRPPLAVGIHLPPPVHVRAIHVQIQYARQCLPLARPPVAMMPIRLLVRLVQPLQHGVLRGRRGEDRVRRSVIGVHGCRIVPRDARRVAPHYRGWFLRGGTMLRQRGRQLRVAHVRRHVHNLDAALGFDEGVEVALGMPLNPIAILALEYVVRHVRLVLLLLLFVVLALLVDAVRRRGGFCAHSQPARGYEVAHWGSQVVRTVGILLGNDTGIHVLQTL